MAENDELKSFIADCNTKLVPSTPLLYEASFFKIYVKFEVFLSDIFEKYSIGTSSSKGYCPERKLAFIDEEHLRAVLKGDRQYIDYMKKIESLSKHIFIDNPFNILFEVADNTTIINQMITLRNYIAHESGESKRKYINVCLGNGTFIEPSDFLKMQNRRISKSYYTLFVEKIIELSDMILEQPLV